MQVHETVRQILQILYFSEMKISFVGCLKLICFEKEKIAAIGTSKTGPNVASLNMTSEVFKRAEVRIQRIFQNTTCR